MISYDFPMIGLRNSGFHRTGCSSSGSTNVGDPIGGGPLGPPIQSTGPPQMGAGVGIGIFSRKIIVDRTKEILAESNIN